MININDLLNSYFAAWNEGFSTKDGELIRHFMSKDFVGYWAHSDISEPTPYYYDYDLDSVLKQMDNAHKSFELLSSCSRNNDNEVIVLGKETNVINEVPYSAQCMFIWRNEDSEWKLLREYIELER